MGVSDTYSRGRELVFDRPITAVVTLLGVLVAVDLVWKLVSGSLPVAQLLTLLTDGIVVGLAVGLAGIGLSMTYSILNFANFGHGDYVTGGAFMGWAAAYVVAGLGTVAVGDLVLIQATDLGLAVGQAPLAILAGLLVAAVGTIGLSLLLDRVVYRPMRDQDGITLLIASIGVALALRYIIAFVWKTGTKGVTASPGKTTLAGVTFTNHELTLVLASAGLMLGVHILLQRTKLGKAMRAMADNKNLARVTGIPTERVIRMTWIIGGGLTGIAGYLLVLERGTMSFSFGWVLLLLIFAAVILGGIGSIYGAMAGGLIIGVVDAISIVWLPSGLTRAAAFLVLIVVLLVKPEGLFGGVKTA
jgi:branched-chain amino acid transport system permease protein